MLLTSYQTLWQRSLAYPNGKLVFLYSKSKDGKSLRRKDGGDKDGEHIALTFDPDDSTSYKCLIRGRFARVYCDEGQFIRGPKTKANMVLHLIDRKAFFIVSATPIVNHPRDAIGYLPFYYNDNWGFSNDAYKTARIYEDDFDYKHFAMTTQKYDTKVVTICNATPLLHGAAMDEFLAGAENQLWVLSPDNYETVGNRESWKPAACRLMLEAIYKRLVLQIDYQTIIDLHDGMYIP